MVVLLVLAMFLTFALADLILTRGKVPKLATRDNEASGVEPVVIDGFRISPKVRYHPGHAWCMQEHNNLERVGADEFAATLVGPIDKIELPKPGQWIRQGQRAWAMLRNGERVEMISPVEGEVTEINREIVKNPALLRQDPYGRGWLMTVHVPDEENTCRNLLPRNLVSNWMRAAAEGLYARQPQLVGATAADGGLPVEDLSTAIPVAEWHRLAEDFFLTGSTAVDSNVQ